MSMPPLLTVSTSPPPCLLCQLPRPQVYTTNGLRRVHNQWLMLFARLYDLVTFKGQSEPLWTFTIVTTAMWDPKLSSLFGPTCCLDTLHQHLLPLSTASVPINALISCAIAPLCPI
ncbi:hypothetical protein DFH94DRAFT_681431 [Russula ochroleuca]|uniref:Uncharacterized protein n=1 Tax=Russula ochroleuca TaxID=152965 RepID=A0A9P5T9A0_9AGAM|nr:hypothetical protein DFH94DRAFT_681431 [Russula ochroleuca]